VTSGQPKMRKFTNSLEALLDSFKGILDYRRRKHFVGNGFEIRDISTWDVEYGEQDHVLKISTGIGNGTSGKWYDTWVTVELDRPLTWEHPYAGEPITNDKKAQIKANLQNYFDTFGIPFEFVE